MSQYISYALNVFQVTQAGLDHVVLLDLNSLTHGTKWALNPWCRRSRRSFEPICMETSEYYGINVT